MMGVIGMSSFLSQSVQDELVLAQKLARRRKATRAVHVGDEAYPIYEMTGAGFAVDADDAPRLRGFIDIFEGSRHLYQALIVASAQDGDVMRYEFKRNTATATQPPADFEREVPATAGLLPSF